MHMVLTVRDNDSFFSKSPFKELYNHDHLLKILLQHTCTLSHTFHLRFSFIFKLFDRVNK